ncbi:MAG: class I SAM-dependent methyltransferase [Bryobacteraceae bacterium]|nr:class I SAM-dependent methyltransferase [Bryobacteraceae bacterium]
MSVVEAQSIAVKRAQVEFHNFASLGEPERALAAYSEENQRRGAVIRAHAEFIGEMTPFAEIGSNAGHTSYMLANEFGADGFALDISADSLRHGIALKELWRLEREPVRVAGDALNLPFADGSLRCVLAFQMLSQFMDIEQVFLEVKRVLAPGGVFIFAEEPLRRKLSLRLYRCPYYDTMKPWERKLYDWGLLGYLVRDVIGAHQEESFGIRQNHRMNLGDWHALITKHFVEHRYQLFVPQRGWGERVAYRAARALDRHGSEWVPARLLGGTLAAICRKEGSARGVAWGAFEQLLRCPDCHTAPMGRGADDGLRCGTCGYESPHEGGVFNLLPSADKKELYPGDRADVLDFSLPGHAERLGEGWYELEGVYGNKYRWMGRRAVARLTSLRGGQQKLRVRGYASERSFAAGEPVRVGLTVNGERLEEWVLERHGLFVLEADVREAAEYEVGIEASPVWAVPEDDRQLTVNVSMVRLAPRD